MMHTRKFVLASLTLVILCIGSATIAKADTITLTLPEFNGPQVNPPGPFPQPPLTVGTFTFTIPTGQQVVGATISGTFGNSVNPSTAAVDLRLDGLLVGQCLTTQPCFTPGGPIPWSFTFSPASFALLADGMAVFTATQTSQTFIRLGVTTLTIETASGAIPEPTTMVLLGTGLAGVAGAVRRRRKARGKD